MRHGLGRRACRARAARVAAASAATRVTRVRRATSAGMTKTILVCGHGPGISDAVARHFGAQGFAVALVARSADKLAAAAEALVARGITAQAFPADLSDP